MNVIENRANPLGLISDVAQTASDYAAEMTGGLVGAGSWKDLALSVYQNLAFDPKITDAFKRAFPTNPIPVQRYLEAVGKAHTGVEEHMRLLESSEGRKEFPSRSERRKLKAEAVAYINNTAYNIMADYFRPEDFPAEFTTAWEDNRRDIAQESIKSGFIPPGPAEEEEVEEPPHIDVSYDFEPSNRRLDITLPPQTARRATSSSSNTPAVPDSLAPQSNVFSGEGGKGSVVFKSLEKAKAKGKKWTVRLTVNGRNRVVHFGDASAQDYTQHHDKSRREDYLRRHKAREDWSKSGIATPGFWSAHLLWGPHTSIAKNLKAVRKAYDI
jgi:hypothetical protein